MNAHVIRTEVIAALTAVALLAPETVAFAQIAGIPPAHGLAAAPLCVLAYAVLGRSPRVIVGATAATAVIASAATLPLSPDPAQRTVLVVALTLITGGLLLITGLLRCGFVARFLAPEALRGFLLGLAVVIVVRQAALMVDVSTRTGNVFLRGWDVARKAPEWNAAALACGLVALVALILLERWLPRLPASLFVLAGAAVLGLPVPHVPSVPAGWPRPGLPGLNGPTWIGLLPVAAGLALIIFALTHGIAERLREESGPSAGPNREMTGLGLANLLAGLVGGLPVAGSPSASSAAQIVGGRTRLLPALSAALLLVTAVVVAPAFGRLPEPVLAAVVIMAVRPYLSLTPLRALWRRDRRGLAIAVSAALGVVTFTLVPGLLIAVALSLGLFLADAARLRVSRLGRTPDGSAYLALERFPGLDVPQDATILRPDGQLFFANIDRLAAAVDAALTNDGHDRIILDLSASFDLSATVLDGLAAIRRRIHQHGRELAFTHLYLATRDAVDRSDLADVPQFTSNDAASKEQNDANDLRPA